MKKRIICLILALTLCLGLLPMTAGAADGADSEALVQSADAAVLSTENADEGGHADHRYCGSTDCDHAESRIQDAKPIATAEDLLMAGEGKYYLSDNITLDKTWEPKHGTVLCLNGKTITAKGVNGAVIRVNTARVFTLLDCKGTGIIRHSGGYGPGVFAAGTFDMYGGTIRDNTGLNDGSQIDFAGGVHISSSGTFHMYGGAVTKNGFRYATNPDDHAGGVYVTKGGKLILSRGAEIFDNYDNGDIYLADGAMITTDGALTGSKRSVVSVRYLPVDGTSLAVSSANSTDVSGHFESKITQYELSERPSDHTLLLTRKQSVVTATIDPAKPTLKEGEQTTLTVNVTGGRGYTLSYQWYQNTQDSPFGGGTAISGETGATFSVPNTLTPGTYYYYCQVSVRNAQGGVIQKENGTAVVRVLGNLTVRKGADVTQPYGTEGGKVTLDITGAEGYTLLYRWYQNDEEAGTGAPIPGATGAEYPIPADTPIGTYYYYCKVTAAGLSEQFTTNLTKVTITKGTLPLTVSTGWVYGSTVPQPSVTGLPAGVTVDQATVTYTDARGNVITPGSETPVGDYHVKVEYTDSNADYSGEADFKVTPILVDKSRVEITNTHTTYDGTTKYAWEVITVTVEVNGKTIPLSSEDFHTGGVTAALGVETPGYRGVLTLQGNYAIVGNEQVDFTWYIDPRVAELELVNADGRKYGDELGNVTMRVANAVSGIGGNVTVRYTGGDDLSVGGHNVTATKLVTKYDGENKNYKLPDESSKRTLTYHVDKADAPASQNLTMDVYNNLAKTYTYDFSQALPALADGLTFGNCTYKGEPNLTTNVVSGIGFHGSVLTFRTGRISSREGTMILSYTATVTSDNYKDFRLILRVQTKDKKAVPVQEDDITMAGWTYGQTPTTPSVKGLPAGVTPTFTYQDATGTDITPTYTTDAGAYTVTVRAETDDTVYTGTKPFTVAPKTLTKDDIGEYDPSGYGFIPNKVYDGNTGFSLSGLGTKKTALVGTLGADDVLYIDGTAAFAGANAGNTELIFTTDGKLSTFPGSTLKPGNYQIAEGLTRPFAARIDQRPIDFTVDSVSKRFGSPDSTADVRVTFTSVSGNNKSGLVDGETLEQGVDYDVTATFSQATIGEDKNVVVTVTLKNTAKARNYALLNGSTNATGTITKAAAPNVPEQIVEIYSNAVTQYPIDLTKGWPAGKPSISDDYTYDGRHNPELNPEEMSNQLYQSASYMLPALGNWAGTIYLSVPQAFTADVGTDLGVLKVIFKSQNYEDLTLRIRFKVKAKAQETLSVSLEGWTYGEPANPPAYTAPAGATETTLTYTSRDGQTSYGATPPTDAGDYTLTVRCEGIDTIWTGSADFTIAKKQITPPAADTTKFAYTALEQTYQLAANAAYTVSPNTTQTDAGDYTITVSLNDTANTEWTDGTTAAKPYTFTIAPAALTVTALDREMIAGEDAPDLSSPTVDVDYKVEGLLGADVLTQVTMSYNETPDTSRAGTYTINIAATLKNYDIATVSGTLTIKPAPTKRQPMGVNVPKSTPGGTIEIDPKNATPGETVTITVKPDKGYEIGDVTVKDIDGEKIDVKRTGDNEFTFVMPKSSVSIKANFVRGGEEFFRDVPANAYYYDAVRWAKQNGITGGIGDNLFGSTLPCTRAQIVTFLWRAAGSPEPKSAANFADVPASAYYAKAVAWAVEEGITNGVGDNKFDPDAPCTRAQCVAFLYRAAGSPKVTGAADFTDVAETAYYAKAVAWAQKQDITDGVSATRFAPQKDCTRAQIVTFLYRAFAE